MFENLDIFKISSAMAVHAGKMQAVAAENVANSDTPEFKARTLTPFAETYSRDVARIGVQSLRATREQHLHGTVEGALGDPVVDKTGIASPNGNTVSLENEMLKSLNAKRQHDRALAIYKSSMTVLRTTLSRG
jgi:flagellar basal-body rod protein FlgB